MKIVTIIFIKLLLKFIKFAKNYRLSPWATKPIKIVIIGKERNIQKIIFCSLQNLCNKTEKIKPKIKL